MGTLCLCMIVRDEADTIEPCIASVRDHIDSWVICDTGSTDGTQDVVRRLLAGIPGDLHERPWVDFGHNRTELMQLARGKADHLLLLDADWEVELEFGALDDLSADSYLVCHAGDVEFHNKRIVSGDLDWRFVGATHEYITCDDEQTCERLTGATIVVRSCGGERKDRWLQDIELLEADLERDPGNERAMFYLAQSCRDLGNLTADDDLRRRAVDCYLRRADLGGWAEEAHCAVKQAGDLLDALGDWAGAQEAYLRAWEMRPQRLEPLYALSVGLRIRDRPLAAHRFASVAAGPRALEVPSDNLYVSPWVYEWGMLFEFSITSFWAEEYDACLAACERLAVLPDLPLPVRMQNRRNRVHAVQKRVARMAEPTLARREAV